MRKSPDLILLHPPSVYDFRKYNDILFPDICSTVLNISPMFEMLPLGFYNIKTYLETHDISVKIYNIANMMLKDWDFDVEDFLLTLRPKVFGIDLHWIVQAHGALAFAKVLKIIHRDIPILFGGISASYFFKELILYRSVDFVIRGNMTLLPIRKLMECITKKDKDYSKIPNLCYKKNGRVMINPSKIYTKKHFYPINWNIKKFRSKNVNFIAINPQSGCRHNCLFCGGSKYSTKRYALQSDAVLYKPYRQICKELDSMKIFGVDKDKRKKLKLITINHWFKEKKLNAEILSKIKKMNLFSTIHLSLFDLIQIAVVRNIVKYINPVFEISPQSHDLKLRRLLGGAKYSNEELEAWAEEVLKLEVKRIEVYFIIGLPGQTVDSVLKTAEYCEYLLERFKDRRNLIPFLSSMVPFLDPGSLVFEKPEQYGYKIFYKTLEEHRKALIALNFKDRLNYETKWMNRDQIINVTYRSIRMLLQAKIRHGYLTQSIGNAIISKMDYERQMLESLNRINSGRDKNSRLKTFKKIESNISQYNKEILKTKFCDQSPMDISIHNSWHEI